MCNGDLRVALRYARLHRRAFVVLLKCLLNLKTLFSYRFLYRAGARQTPLSSSLDQ